MPGSNDLRYTYAVARIRAIEKKLLDKSKLDRMIDSSSPEDALKVLVEADYGLASGEAANAYGYEAILAEERVKVYRLLKEIAPEPGVFDIFLIQNDYHNIKAFLRAEFSSGKELDTGILMEPGTIGTDKLRASIRDRNLSELPPIMKKAVEECIELFNRTRDPMSMDVILDKAAYSQMKDMADKSGNSFLKELISILIDLTNMKMFLRLKRLKKTWDFLQKVLIPGGNVDTKVFIEFLETSYEAFVEAMRYKRYGQLLEESIEKLKQTGSMTEFEKRSDNFIISHAKKAKYLAFGMEPLVGYILAKENEIRNARIVLVGKINKMPNDIIRERLRESYV